VRDSSARDATFGAVRAAPVFTCTACGQRWLVAGLEEGEMYTCRSCGHSFRARRDEADSRALQPPVARPSRRREAARGENQERAPHGRAQVSSGPFRAPGSCQPRRTAIMRRPKQIAAPSTAVPTGSVSNR
jgi:DNA-directed RNA polymerase subunit RPC12/RpoP